MSEAARDGPETAKRAGKVMAEEEEEAPAALLLEELEEDDEEPEEEEDEEPEEDESLLLEDEESLASWLVSAKRLSAGTPSVLFSPEMTQPTPKPLTGNRKRKDQIRFREFDHFDIRAGSLNYTPIYTQCECVMIEAAARGRRSVRSGDLSFDFEQAMREFRAVPAGESCRFWP